MPETATVDGPPVAKVAATVSASALAIHLDCSRIYIGKLEAEGVIQRQGDGFPLDQSRPPPIASSSSTATNEFASIVPVWSWLMSFRCALRS